jgi:hypothetical protein
MNRKVKWRILSKKFDKFRRGYIVWLDRSNLEPTGQVERMFAPPFDNYGNVVDIPDNYANGRRGITFPPDSPWRVELDLDGYARYLKAALAEWEYRYKQIRDKRPKDEGEHVALDMAGPKPLDWRLIVLMSRGDPWCLGLSKKRTPAVEKLIGPAPTARELRAERERPKDLRLDPELEALIGQGVDSAFPDEVDEELKARDRSVTNDDLEIAGIDPAAVLADDEEDELTGDFNLDLDSIDASGLDDLDARLDIEEEVDPAPRSRRKENPSRNRTRPEA